GNQGVVSFNALGSTPLLVCELGKGSAETMLRDGKTGPTLQEREAGQGRKMPAIVSLSLSLSLSLACARLAAGVFLLRACSYQWQGQELRCPYGYNVGKGRGRRTPIHNKPCSLRLCL
ncbi:hypothetical protein GOP47_0021182, partial [Adiantum capillus-veneris]